MKQAKYLARTTVLNYLYYNCAVLGSHPWGVALVVWGARLQVVSEMMGKMQTVMMMKSYQILRLLMPLNKFK